MQQLVKTQRMGEWGHSTGPPHGVQLDADGTMVTSWRCGLYPAVKKGWPMVLGLSGDCKRGTGLGVDLVLSLRTLSAVLLNSSGLRELYK